jgi:transcriptional regulator with XRE-family HTH domain
MTKRKQDDQISLLIGRRIRERRLEMSLSQEALGAKCGLDRTYIGAVERAEKRITVVTLNKIAQALKKPITHFVDPT